MGHWLAHQDAAKQMGTVKRFDPRYWTIDFPRPMMASVVTTGPHSLRVDAVFYRQNDLAGLIWEAADRHDHPLLRYETSRDFRHCTLRFRWRSEGLVGLDAVHGELLSPDLRRPANVARRARAHSRHSEESDEPATLGVSTGLSGRHEDVRVCRPARFDLAAGLLHPAGLRAGAAAGRAPPLST